MTQLVPMDTPEQRRRALDALPRAMGYVMEGQYFYGRRIWETQVGLTTYYSCPWMWFYPPSPDPRFF